MDHTRPTLQTITVALFTTTLAYAAEALPLASGSDFVGFHASDDTIDMSALAETDFLGLETSAFEHGLAGKDPKTNNKSNHENIPIDDSNKDKKIVVSGSPFCGDMLFAHAYSMQHDREPREIGITLEDAKADTFGMFSSARAGSNQEINLGKESSSTNDLIEFPSPVVFCPFYRPSFGSRDGDNAVVDEFINIGISHALSPDEPFQFTSDQASGVAPDALQSALAEATAVTKATAGTKATAVAKVTAVPEPGILSLIGVGLLGMTWFVRRHQRSRRRTQAPR